MPRHTRKQSGGHIVNASAFPKPREHASVYILERASDLVPNETLAPFDFWRELSPGWDCDKDESIDKTNKEKELIAPGKDEKKLYYAIVMRFNFGDGGQPREFYCIIERLTERERQELIPFCECRQCRQWVWTCCVQCCGCLMAPTNQSAQSPIALNARRLRLQRNGVPPRWRMSLANKGRLTTVYHFTTTAWVVIIAVIILVSQVLGWSFSCIGLL